MIESASDALVHRGPDDAGVYFCDNVGFGFRRLAIIDPSAGGHQPMRSADGDLTIVFNGEIYNYLELRTELIGLGHVFRSSSDTEVLLAAYRQWGAQCVHRFNGMWAFVIHDRKARTLFGARDRLGVKPLYLWQDTSWLVLASEPRAIGATGLVPLRPDWTRLAESIVNNRMDHDGGTCLAGIRQVPAACRFWVDARGALKEERYWELPSGTPDTAPRPVQEWVDEVGSLVTDALRLRLRSDVPVGFTLSGGIDSSLLISEAARYDEGRASLVAFCYHDRHFDEREQVRDTVAMTGARLIEIHDETLDIADQLPEIIRAHGEPVHSLSAVANYALFGLARRHGVKVVIGGQGADESFAGYANFQWNYWHTLASDRRFAALVADVRASTRLQGGSAVATLLGSLHRSLRALLGETSWYRDLRSRRGSAPKESMTSRLFSPELRQRAAPPDLRSAQCRLAGAQRHQLSIWPLPMYLRIEDRNSMAQSVEARLPFTDYRLVELGLRMPEELRYAGGVNKVGLRRAAATRVPRSVSARVHKYGFPVRAGPRSQVGLHALCADLAASQSFRERGLYDLAAVRRLLDDPDRGGVAQVDALFQLAQTELWLRNLPQAPAFALNGAAR